MSIRPAIATRPVLAALALTGLVACDASAGAPNEGKRYHQGLDLTALAPADAHRPYVALISPEAVEVSSAKGIVTIAPKHEIGTCTSAKDFCRLANDDQVKLERIASVKKVSYCAGTLVDASTIVTAQHCLSWLGLESGESTAYALLDYTFDDVAEDGTVTVPESRWFEVRLATKDGRPLDGYEHGCIEVPKGEERLEDWAILKIIGDPPDGVELLPLSKPGSLGAGASVTANGHPLGGPLHETNGEVIDCPPTTLVPTTLDVFRFSSGSAALDSEGHLVGTAAAYEGNAFKTVLLGQGQSTRLCCMPIICDADPTCGGGSHACRPVWVVPHEAFDCHLVQ